MASQESVSELKVEELKELAAKHNVEVESSDKKSDLVEKVSAAITPEDLEAYKGDSKLNEDPAGSVPEDVNTPPVESDTAAATDEAHEDNNQVNPAATAEQVRESELKETVAKDEAHREEMKAIDADGTKSPEEAAAKRAGVGEERMTGAKVGKVESTLSDEERENGDEPVVLDEGATNFQNRAPRNKFEQENQEVTDVERQAAQKRSNMSSQEKVENSETPAETATQDAEQTARVNEGSAIADAIREGMKGSTEKNFKLTPDEGVEPRFSLVKNKSTGEVLIRENENGVLSQIQLKSLEEKESSLQDTEIEEL